MITEELQKLYQEYTGVPVENITELPSSGSNRRYFRLTGAKTLIGVCGTSVEENDAFLYMAAHFRKSGLPVPEVHIVSENKSYYLQEDLGDTLLFHAIEKGRATSVFSEEEKELLRKTIRLLPAIQFAGADGFDFSRCYPQPEFNQRSILWDLNYFKYENNLQVYYGILKHEVDLVEEKNKLEWVVINEKLLDNSKFAGNYNIPHIIRQIKVYLKNGTSIDKY